MKINYVNYGIASRVGNQIFLNKRLNEHPKLKNAILRHEKAHTSGFSSRDILLDLNNKHLRGLKYEYYRFILKNPSTWSEFSPFWIQDKKFIINPMVLVIFLFLAIYIRILIWFIGIM